jgi:hypothetical protein
MMMVMMSSTQSPSTASKSMMMVVMPVSTPARQLESQTEPQRTSDESGSSHLRVAVGRLLDEDRGLMNVRDGSRLLVENLLRRRLVDDLLRRWNLIDRRSVDHLRGVLVDDWRRGLDVLLILLLRLVLLALILRRLNLLRLRARILRILILRLARSTVAWISIALLLLWWRRLLLLLRLLLLCWSLGRHLSVSRSVRWSGRLPVGGCIDSQQSRARRVVRSTSHKGCMLQWSSHPTGEDSGKKHRMNAKRRPCSSPQPVEIEASLQRTTAKQSTCFARRRVCTLFLCVY